MRESTARPYYFHRLLRYVYVWLFHVMYSDVQSAPGCAANVSGSRVHSLVGGGLVLDIECTEIVTACQNFSYNPSTFIVFTAGGLPTSIQH
jgi:hypothetical protein